MRHRLPTDAPLSVGQSVPLVERYDYHWGVYVCGYPLVCPTTGPLECPTIYSGVSSGGIHPVCDSGASLFFCRGNSQSPVKPLALPLYQLWRTGRCRLGLFFCGGFFWTDTNLCKQYQKFTTVLSEPSVIPQKTLVWFRWPRVELCSSGPLLFQSNPVLSFCQSAGG